MAIDSVSLLAHNSYSQIQNKPKVSEGSQEGVVNEAVSFQKIMQKDFNNFAKMSPEQILQHIQNAKAGGGGGAAAIGRADGHVITSAVKEVRKTLVSQEDLVRKSLINEASLIDVLTATTQATNTMKTIVEVRNKFLEAFEKVLNMSI